MRPPTVLAQVVLAPGKLGARIFFCEINSGAGPVPCWVYVTEGLAAFGQREIAFALRIMPHENAGTPPPDVLHFYSTVLGLAEQGRLVDAGGFSGFGPGGFLGDPNLRGVGYLRNHPYLGLPAPADALVAIALMGIELEVAQQFGATRVAARLGQAA